MLLASVRFVNNVASLTPEPGFVRLSKTDTKDDSMFDVVEKFFNEKDTPLSSILV